MILDTFEHRRFIQKFKEHQYLYNKYEVRAPESFKKRLTVKQRFAIYGKAERNADVGTVINFPGV